MGRPSGKIVFVTGSNRLIDGDWTVGSRAAIDLFTHPLEDATHLE